MSILILVFLRCDLLKCVAVDLQNNKIGFGMSIVGIRCAMAFTKSCNKNNCFFFYFFSLVNNF